MRPLIAGASCGCSEVFGAKAGVEACGVPLLRQHALPGTSGLASVRGLVGEGFTPHVF